MNDSNCKKLDFCLIGHPFSIDHLYRYLKYRKPNLKKPRRDLLLKLFEWTPPFNERQVEITSPHKTVYGNIIVCPLLPEMVNPVRKLDPLQFATGRKRGISTPLDSEHLTGHFSNGVKHNKQSHFRSLCIEKVISALKLAVGQGARISGLGGFTSIADGDQGKLVASKVPGIAVTSGNTLTAMAAVDGVIFASKMLGLKLSEATAAVIGASGDIGTACCRFLAKRVRRLVLTSRFSFNLLKIANELKQYKKAEIIVEKENKKAVSQANIVITAASSVAPIFHQRDFKPGTIVCDVGYPKNIFVDYKIENSDIFLFSGGLLTSPVPVIMPYDMGLPNPNVLYGCWCEAIVLALERRYESFSLGRGLITPERMQLIWKMAKKHGFGRAPFFFGEEIWTEEQIHRIRKAKDKHR